MENCFQKEGKRVKFSINGEGTPVLFLHGYTESKEIWNDFSLALQANYTIIAMDLPGHGQTELPEINSMESWAGIVKALLEHLEVGPVVLIGHSMGGYLCCEFADLYPELVLGLCLFNSSGRADTAEGKQSRLRVMDVIAHDRGAFLLSFINGLVFHENREKLFLQIENLHKQAEKISLETLLICQKVMLDRQGHIEMLVDASFPIMFIIGKQDSRLDFNHVFAQTILPKRSLSLVIENCGHLAYIEAPKESLSAIKGFIEMCS